MRKVKVGAIQPGYPEIPDNCNCLSDSYRPIPEEIFKNHLTKHMDVTLRLLEKAGQEGCDMVTTSEDVTGTGFYGVDITERNLFPRLVGVTTPVIESELTKIASKHAMYIVACYYKQEGSHIYNVACIFDRKGSICGKYRKTHLPADEKWQVSEGDRMEVFNLDFGKVGICTCYDMMFPEHVRVLSLLGAEMVFHPTLGYGWYDDIGEATLRTRANDGSLYLVTSKNYVYNRAGKSSIIDPWGHVLADAAFYKDVLITKELDLDQRKIQPQWFNPVQMSGVADLRLRNEMERRPELYGEICSPSADKITVPEKVDQLSIIDKIKRGQCRW